jgi:hypothetical protein
MIGKSRLGLMNASLMQEIEVGKGYIAQREKEYEMTKAAMENELRLVRQAHFEALKEKLVVSYAVERR